MIRIGNPIPFNTHPAFISFIKAALLFLSIFLSNNSYSQNKIAILIGNQNYEYQSNLLSPHSEIDLIAEICLGQEFNTIKLYDLDYNEFNKLFDTIEYIIESADLFYFHYSGHGVQIDGQNYFVPTDVRPVSESQLKRQCHRFNTLIEILENSAFKNDFSSIVCIDACRNNPFQDSHIYLRSGLSEYKSHLPPNTALIYSTAPGKTSLDGKDGLSPFAYAWTNRLKDCTNSVLDILTLIPGDILDRNIPADRQPYINFTGLHEVAFCNEYQSLHSSDNVTNLVSTLYNSALKNYELEQYHSAIDRFVWIDSILNRYPYNWDTKWLIEMAKIKAKCYLNTNHLLIASDILFNIWTTFELNSESGKDSDFKDIYYLLYHILSLLNDSERLPTIRNDYLNYCKTNNLTEELIITYDKIAGDFERSGQLDSAIHYYNISISLFEDQPLTRTLAFNAFFIYSNLGNALVWLTNNNDGLNYLMNAYNLNQRFSLNRIFPSENLASYYTFYDYSLDSVMKYLIIEEELLNNSKNRLIDSEQASQFYRHYIQVARLKYIAYRKSEYKEETRIAYKEYHKLMTEKIRYQLKDSSQVYKEYTPDCEIGFIKIRWQLDFSFQPILFVDHDQNFYIDSLDYAISFEGDYSKTRRSYNLLSDVKLGEVPLIVYEDAWIPINGTFIVFKNSLSEYDNLKKGQQLENCHLTFSNYDNNTLVWELMVPIDDIGSVSDSEIIFGARNPKTKEIFLYPIETGIEYIH